MSGLPLRSCVQLPSAPDCLMLLTLLQGVKQPLILIVLRIQIGKTNHPTSVCQQFASALPIQPLRGSFTCIRC